MVEMDKVCCSEASVTKLVIPLSSASGGFHAANIPTENLSSLLMAMVEVMRWQLPTVKLKMAGLEVSLWASTVRNSEEVHLQT